MLFRRRMEKITDNCRKAVIVGYDPDKRIDVDKFNRVYAELKEQQIKRYDPDMRIRLGL